MIRSALISLIVAATGATAQPRSEVGGTFTLPGIPGELRWLNDPLDWSASGGTLVITAGKETDLFLDPRGEYAVESSPRALFTPDEHFLLSSRTEVAFASTYDAGSSWSRAGATSGPSCVSSDPHRGRRRSSRLSTRGSLHRCCEPRSTGLPCLGISSTGTGRWRRSSRMVSASSNFAVAGSYTL